MEPFFRISMEKISREETGIEKGGRREAR